MTRSRWLQTRLKYMVDANVGVLPESTDDDFKFVYVDIGNVSQGSICIAGEPIRFREAPSRARRLAWTGDSVVSTVRTYLRAVAMVPAHDEPVVFSTGFAVLSPRHMVDPGYMSWYLQGDGFVSRIEANSTGVSYPAITATQLVGLGLELPPLEEQRGIADYLDRETARIDTLIEEQQRLIEMLRERRAAVLFEAFQSGPSANTTKLGRLLAVRPSYGVLVPRYVDEGGGVPFVRVGDLLNLAPVRPMAEISTEQSDEFTRTKIVGGEVLLGVVGKMGQAVIAPQWLAGANVARAVGVLRCKDSRVAPLLCAWLGSIRFLVQAELATSGDSIQPTLGMKDLAQFEINIPTDVDAAADLTGRLVKIDRLASEVERFIKLSRERRSALITTAVTGQIDVGAVA